MVATTWRPVQKKSGWEKQKEKEAKEEVGRKKEEWERRKPKKRKLVEVKRVAEEWKIWDKEEEVAKSEVEAKKLALEKFHKWIKVFSKKQLERIPIRKV